MKYHIILAVVFVLLVGVGFAYDTQREEHLYNNVYKTVDLPWFWDYQDLLASYAYNTCQKKLPWEKWKYSCENLVQTWNAENGWWRRDAKNTSNSNWTHDWWLCQLNSNYHINFMKSERFEPPLAQLDYCLQVRVDAKSKYSMPRYAYAVRNKRDKGIQFLQSNAGEVKPTETVAIRTHTTGCRYVWQATHGEKIQVDKHTVVWFISVLREWIVGEWETGKIFICDE